MSQWCIKTPTATSTVAATSAGTATGGRFPPALAPILLALMLRTRWTILHWHLVQRRRRFHSDPIIMVFRIPPLMRNKNLENSSNINLNLSVITWCPVDGFSSPGRRSGWVCQMRQHLLVPACDPYSAVNSVRREWISEGWHLRLSRNYQPTIEPKINIEYK